MSGATAEQRLPHRGATSRPGTPGARGDRLAAAQPVRLGAQHAADAWWCWRWPLLILPPLFRWGIAQASLSGTTRAACTGDGACWTFIRVRLPLFFYGRYPASEYWRVDLVGVLLVAFCIPGPARQRAAPLAVGRLLLLTLFPALAAVLLLGRRVRPATMSTPRCGAG